MATIKNNIFLIFYLMLFLGTIVLSTIIYRNFVATKYEYIIEQENITKINSNSLYFSFLQYEMLLDILGNELSFNDNYKSLKHSRVILDKLLKLNTSIVAFGLARADGQLYITSSNLKHIKSLPNLLKKEETKKSFLHTLEKDVMVIGRTYYHKGLKTLLIPIRKTIRNEKNEVVAIMTAGIYLNKAFKFFKNENTFILRAFDYYKQISQKKNNQKKDYEKSIPKDIRFKLVNNIEHKYKTDMKSIKEGEKLITIKNKAYFKKNQEYLTSIVYIKRFELWTITQTPYTKVMSKVYKESTILILLFIIIYIILFFFFRLIDTFERKKQGELYYQATHDPLTKLYNRLYLSHEFEENKNKKDFTLLIIDIDNFRSINDTYGHDYGDIILKEISLRLSSLKINNDALIRYSADEFLFITKRVKEKDIKVLLDDIFKSLEKVFIYKQYEYKISASIGISVYPKDGKNFDEVKRHADLALSEAKKHKNSICFFQNAIKLKYLQTSLIEEALKTALDNKEIYMTYQVQLDKNENIYGVEALVRWNNKKLGPIAPDIFIKIAENSGMMTILGDYIIQTSLKEITSLYKKMNRKFQLSLNISYKQFLDINFYDKLSNEIAINDFNQELLTLEVTENIFIEDIDFVLNLLHKIRKDKIKISLDDFGTGYSSLSLLKKLPIDELKIDKSFVDDIVQDKDSLSMVEAIISLGKKLNMVVLAEGVESIEQKRLLLEKNCDLFQGYLYSKPLKIKQLENFLKVESNI